VKKLHNIAGQVMSSLEAFDGSRAALDAPEILIVRGMSRKRFNQEDLKNILANILDEVGAENMDVLCKDSKDIIGIMDENIRSNVEIQGETDIYGLYRLKKSLEAMNCYVEYALGCLDDTGIFIVLWMDKSGLGPRFVEVVVTNIQ